MSGQQLGNRPGDAPSAAAVGDQLQELTDRIASRRRTAHVVIGVASGAGTFRWIGAAGEARPGEPMTAETPYFVASVTKLFIATTVLQLVERGAVDLDAPFAIYLPVGTIAGLHRFDGVDHTLRITVRHLLSHTSGLPDYLEDRRKGKRSWYDAIADGSDRKWTFDDVVRRSRDELIPHFPPRDLTADRVRARYSDTGFQLLIAIVEEVTGQPFHEVLEQRIIRPLDLRQTWLPGRSEPLEPTLEPALVYHGDRPLDVPQALVSCNDLMGTVDDNLTFMRALTRGELFDDPATYELMRARFNRIFFPMRYGLGMMRFPINRVFSPIRRPIQLVGHAGGTGSWLFHCPELDLLVAGTVDQVRGRSAPFRIMPKVLRIANR